MVHAVKVENWSIYHRIQLLWYDGVFAVDTVVVVVLRISQRIYTINIVMHRPEPSIISNMQAVPYA